MPAVRQTPIPTTVVIAQPGSPSQFGSGSPRSPRVVFTGPEIEKAYCQMTAAATMFVITGT